LAGGGGEPPARAGNFLRRNVDMLFKTDQLPVAGAVGNANPDLRARPIMTSLERSVSPNRRPAPNAAHGIPDSEQRRTDALALPAVVDRQTELELALSMSNA